MPTVQNRRETGQPSNEIQEPCLRATRMSSSGQNSEMPALVRQATPPTMLPPRHFLQLAAAGCAAPLRAALAGNPDSHAIRDDIGRTPLHVAAAEGHTHIVKLLLDYGADSSAVDTSGNTPADDAVKHGRVRCLRLLAARDAKLPGNLTHQRLHPAIAPARALFDAAYAGNVRAATVAVAAFGAHVNCTNVDGRTPLHVAVTQEHADVAAYLIASGADPARTDRWGRTPTLLANACNNQAIRALFDGIRNAAATAVVSAIESAEASTPLRRRGASLPRITRVANNPPLLPEAVREQVKLRIIQNNSKRHSAPHIVKVHQDSPERPEQIVDLVSPTEQKRLLESSITKAQNFLKVASAEEALRRLETRDGPVREFESKDLWTREEMPVISKENLRSKLVQSLPSVVPEETSVHSESVHRQSMPRTPLTPHRETMGRRTQSLQSLESMEGHTTGRTGAKISKPVNGNGVPASPFRRTPTQVVPAFVKENQPQMEVTAQPRAQSVRTMVAKSVAPHSSPPLGTAIN